MLVEMQEYENSLNYYRDLKNVTDTAHEEGKIVGIHENKITVATAMLENGEPIEKIMRFTGLTREEIENLRNNKS